MATYWPIVIGAFNSRYRGVFILQFPPIVKRLVIGPCAVSVILPRITVPLPIDKPHNLYKNVRSLFRELCGSKETKNWTTKYRGWTALNSSCRTVTNFECSFVDLAIDKSVFLPVSDGFMWKVMLYSIQTFRQSVVERAEHPLRAST